MQEGCFLNADGENPAAIESHTKAGYVSYIPALTQTRQQEE